MENVRAFLFSKIPLQTVKNNHRIIFSSSGNNVTGDSAFSMFNLSLREEWTNNKKFCHRLSDDEDDAQDVNGVTAEATIRLNANMSRQSSPNGSTAQLTLLADQE